MATSMATLFLARFVHCATSRMGDEERGFRRARKRARIITLCLVKYQKLHFVRQTCHMRSDVPFVSMTILSLAGTRQAVVTSEANTGRIVLLRVQLFVDLFRDPRLLVLCLLRHMLWLLFLDALSYPR